MWLRIPLLLPALVGVTLFLSSVQAQQQVGAVGGTLAPAPSEDKEGAGGKIAYRVNADVSYVGDGYVNGGVGDISEIRNTIKTTATIPVSEGIFLNVGADWERLSFGLPGGPSPALPNTLQVAAAVLGFDMALSEDWIMRFEIQPGIYSDFKDISFDDFNCPVTIGFSYLQSEDVQWVFGLAAAPRSEIPVLPGAGVRWRFEDDWTLNAILPQPRIEYSGFENITLYVGANLYGGTYVVSENFGNQVGKPGLNNDPVDYLEARTGVGANWKIMPALSLEAEAGAMVYRRIDYWRSDLNMDGSPAPYGQLALEARF
jgi:hypothetical protein